MDKQLCKNHKDVARIERALSALQHELDREVLAEPTGYPREELSTANIHLLAALSSLREVL